MSISHAARRALAGAVAAPLLSVATAAASVPHTIHLGATVYSFGGVARSVHRRPSWIAPAAMHGGILYGSSYDGGFINLYSLKGKDQAPIGQLSAGLTSPQGLAVDRHHRLWVANTNAYSVVGFKRGASSPFATLNDAGFYPVSVAVDSNGTVYAANAEGVNGPPGNVTVWAKGSTNPTATLTYASFEIVLGLGVDAQNDLFVTYIPTSGPPSMVEFPAGSQNGVPVSIEEANVGDITFDESGNLVMEDLENTLGIWAPPFTSGPERTIPVLGNEPTFDRKEKTIWLAYANFSTPKIFGYDYATGSLHDTITNGWTASAIPYGVATDPAASL
jgi:hypothetical protein